MEFFIEPKIEKRKKADLLAIPFWETEKGAISAASLGSLEKSLKGPLQSKDFRGKRGEIFFVYVDEERIALLGLGKKEKASVETLRRAYGALGFASQPKKVSSIHLVSPHLESLSLEKSIEGISEGLLLANYSFLKLKGSEKDKQRFSPIEKVTFLGNLPKLALEIAKKRAFICEGVNLARNLVNDNADTITPPYLADLARSFGKKYKQLKVTVFDKKRIEKEKMGLLLAVNRGSNLDPAFIMMEYKGNPKSKEHTVVVGKGITYDTGGLNLKTGTGMETMKCDMSGAATCFGLVLASVLLHLPVNFTAVIPTTENSISSSSYKPGDVYISHNGKTVEIGNTDAEGRLILADALSYTVQHLKPTRIIDFATLTGSIDVALGAEATGMMSNNDALAHSLISAGESTQERLWRMPLFEEYLEQLRSDIADLRNVGTRSGGACVAACFLKEFIGDIPWAHCDIASTAFLTKGKDYLPKYATGVGVRLMVEFFENYGR